jgi:hypothetical protein
MHGGAIMRVVYLCVSLIVCLFFSNVGYSEINPANIAGMWLFDEGSGDVVSDSSDNGNNGAFMGDPQWINGKFGKALEFDGDDYIAVPDSDSIDMNEHLTVMFWVRSDKEMLDMWADRQAVIGKHYLEYEVGIYMDGQLHTYTNDGTGGGYDEGIMASIGGKLPGKEADWEDNWLHVAWTLNGAHEIAYVNGVKVGEYDKAHEGTIPGTHTLEIGRRQGGGIPTVGIVDEVIVLRTVLEQEDIEFAYKKGLEAALGLMAVLPNEKLITTWGDVKNW